MFSRMNPAILTTIACLTLSVGAYGQVSTATITGVVQDSGGAVIQGATVSVTQAQTNTIAKAVTTERGSFTLPALPVGPYSMEVISPGFSRYKRTNVVLTVGQTANFEIALAVVGSTEAVTVSTGAPSSIRPTLRSKTRSMRRRSSACRSTDAIRLTSSLPPVV